MNWKPEDSHFWENYAKKIAYRNLWASVSVLTVAFMAWMIWSNFVIYLKIIRPDFSSSQLYWLTAIPLISAGFLRIIYSFTVPIFGGKKFTLFSTAIIIVPMLMILHICHSPEINFNFYILSAILTGFPGANFASSSANISFFFPHRLKGIALGINAAIGNLGVGIIQLVAPWLVTINFDLGFLNFNRFGFAIENIPLLIIGLCLISLFIIIIYMDDISDIKSDIKSQLSILKDRNNWIMCTLYTTTFGSFIGFASVFPIVLVSQFHSKDTIKLVFLGATLSSLMRPVGHLMSKNFGSVKTTQVNFLIMIFGIISVISFLPNGDYPGNLNGVIISFLILFMGTGIGKGSTTAMIPDIFNLIYKKSINNSTDNSYQKSITNTASTLGFSSAIATIGAFFIPYILSEAEYYFNHIQFGMLLIGVLYIISLCINYYFYMRKNQNNPFYSLNNKKFELLDTPEKQKIFFQHKNETENIKIKEAV